MESQNRSDQGFVRSVLDTDLYKLTMQQAVLHHFPRELVTYRFTNWSPSMQFNIRSFEAIKNSIQDLSSLRLQSHEEEWLRNTCPYFKDSYLDYLREFRFRPSQHVTIKFIESKENKRVGQIDLQIRGLWAETILYEVPIMAIVNEAYFTLLDCDWSYDGQQDLAFSKGRELFQNGIMLSEFGTRRRRSYLTQDLVLSGLIRAHSQQVGEGHGGLYGTSNPHFAMKYGITPLGTLAHEWIMGTAAIVGYEKANMIACQNWEAVYPPHSTSGVMHVALTDTFSSESFFKDFAQNSEVLDCWRGLRQDSGDPFEFVRKAKRAYDARGLNVKDKLIIFSDSLDVQKCLELKKACDEAGFISGYGIGTFLQNDFKRLSTGRKSNPLITVIKLASVNGQPCIKISDDIAKNTGNNDLLNTIKMKLGIPVY